MTVPKADRLQPWHPLEQRLNAAFCRECIDMFSWSLAEPLLLNDEEMGGRFSGGAASAGPRNMLASSAKTPGAAALSLSEIHHFVFSNYSHAEPRTRGRKQPRVRPLAPPVLYTCVRGRVAVT